MMQKRKPFRSVPYAAAAVLTAGFAFGTPAAHAASLKIDPEHSSVSFKVTHLMFMKVTGHFRQFEGSFDFDDETGSISNVAVTIQASSLDTNVEARDKDLRSKRFFNVDKYPTLTFTSTGTSTFTGSKGQIKGVLSMHGVEKEVVLDTEFLGKGKDPWGNLKYGFQATTTINRKDFGMAWNEVLEAGGVMVGDEVELILNVEAAPAT
ncbi:MAG: YceI family protein [Nitrospirales bacterium]